MYTIMLIMFFDYWNFDFSRLYRFHHIRVALVPNFSFKNWFSIVDFFHNFQWTLYSARRTPGVNNKSFHFRLLGYRIQLYAFKIHFRKLNYLLYLFRIHEPSYLCQPPKFLNILMTVIKVYLHAYCVLMWFEW